MIFLDTDIIILDQWYQTDPRFGTNRLFLDRLDDERIERAMVLHGLLEVIGKLSYSSNVPQIRHYPVALAKSYGFYTFPDPKSNPQYSSLSYDAIMNQIGKQMSLGDAMMALQIADVAIRGDFWMTWNAKHFKGKIPIPVLTPAE